MPSDVQSLLRWTVLSYCLIICIHKRYRCVRLFLCIMWQYCRTLTEQTLHHHQLSIVYQFTIKIHYDCYGSPLCQQQPYKPPCSLRLLLLSLTLTGWLLTRNLSLCYHRSIVNCLTILSPLALLLSSYHIFNSVSWDSGKPFYVP